jgi:surface-anchored protein
MNNLTLPVVLAGLALASVTARAQVLISNGHVDIGIGYEAGAFDLHIHQEEPAENEYAPNEARFVIGPSSAALSPGGAFTGFLGPAGTPLWVLSAESDELLPKIGFSAEELTETDWTGDIRLSLVSVTGPGNVSLWDVGTFGTPTLLYFSGDGIDASDSLAVPPGSHADYNFGFSAPGLYEVTYLASGTHLMDGAIASGPVTYQFEVVPEPHTYALAAVGLGALLWAGRRTRRA